MKLPNDRESIIKLLRKIATAWEKLTGRNTDMSLSRLRTETLADLKRIAKGYVSKEMKEIWDDSQPLDDAPRRSPRHSSRRRSPPRRR